MPTYHYIINNIIPSKQQPGLDVSCMASQFATHSPDTQGGNDLIFGGGSIVSSANTYAISTADITTVSSKGIISVSIAIPTDAQEGLYDVKFYFWGKDSKNAYEFTSEGEGLKVAGSAQRITITKITPRSLNIEQISSRIFTVSGTGLSHVAKGFLTSTEGGARLRASILEKEDASFTMKIISPQSDAEEGEYMLSITTNSGQIIKATKVIEVTGELV